MLEDRRGSRALNGLLVLDLTRLLPGAVATQTLAAHGARVIKIEQPGVGDYARHEHSNVFAATNRGKESIELDLKDEDGRNALRLLAMEADVLIEGFRPGVMHRLGVDYQHLRALNPRLIYVALTGYGQRGEYSQMAGHDINYLALSGVLAEIGTGEMPVVPGVQLADLAGGSMQVVIGTLLALQARERTGEGQFVDVSMTDGVASLLPIPLSSYAATGVVETRGDSLLTGRYACYGIYRAAEGFVAVGALEPKFWQTLCESLGEPSWIRDQFADEPRRSELKRLLGVRFLEKSAEDWFAVLRDRDCCVTPVRDLASAQPCVNPVPKLSATPGVYAESTPKLGEHTRRFERIRISDGEREMNLLYTLRHPERMHANKLAVIDGETRYTYAEFGVRCRKGASFLLTACGLQRGERVAALLLNRPEYLEAYFSCHVGGLLIVPLNIRWGVEDFVFSLNDSETSAIVVDERFAL